jgi:SsrA-binding protein
MISFSDSYCIFENGELFLKNLSLTPVSFMYGHDVTRDKKLLLKRKELRKLGNDLDKGLTIVPYRIFTNEKGFIKVEIALAKGKKLFDKRNAIKERDMDRDTKRAL